jgi:hypothetical protein
VLLLRPDLRNFRSSQEYPVAPEFISVHPIETLAEYHSLRFNQMLERQSTTLPAAVEEYTRRYGRAPPPGFDGWFDYAKQHNSSLIDDFDSIEETLKVFRDLTPSELRSSAIAASGLGGSRLWRCAVEGGHFQVGGCDWMGQEVSELLTPIPSALPDVVMTLNTLDEPRVLPKPGVGGDVQFRDESKRSIWNTVTESCHSDRGLNYGALSPSAAFGLPFIQDADEAKDLCKHPEYEHMHGFFQSPATFIFTHSTVPIFSPAKPSTFADILYPPPFYMGMYDQGKYKEDKDPSWEDKKAKLYWSGSTTGSHARNADWKTHHRQRFVSTVNLLANQTSTFLTESEPGAWETFQSREIFSQLYDVKFTAVIQCDGGACQEENEFFHPSSREGADDG